MWWRIYCAVAHGDSEGDLCTYGFYEKQDLHRVLDEVQPGPIVLFGTSLGAAVALQEAAGDRRVTAVVAAETFSDLRTVAIERAPFFFSSGVISCACVCVEQQGGVPDRCRAPDRCRRDHNPCCSFTGTPDADTPPDHSRRVMGAPAGPAPDPRPGAWHNESPGAPVWPGDRTVDRSRGARPDISCELTALSCQLPVLRFPLTADSRCLITVSAV